MSKLDRLYSGELRVALAHADGSWSTDVDLSEHVALAGSFNPLHSGHRRLADVAAQISDRKIVFEISIENVDKPDLPRPELERRLAQFRGIADVAITRARLFSDKAALLPGVWFVVGFDTAVRLLDDRYHSEGDATADLRRLVGLGVKFLVAGRADSQGKFRGLVSLDIPKDLVEMFIPIPESAFREDVSSTALRDRETR